MNAEFLTLAAGEGWITDQWELDFLRATFPQGCLVRRIGTIPVAFITALRYDRSGWIGNLLVSQEQRRQGFGATLMVEALSALEDAGVETVWLTASPSGKPLYEKLGFREIDRIHRWIGVGFRLELPSKQLLLSDEVVALDAAGWGDERKLLLTALWEEGSAVVAPNAFLHTKKIRGLQQIGPLAGNGAATTFLLRQYLTRTNGGKRICLDVPQGNETMVAFLEQQGLEKSGSTVLMYKGVTPAYRPELIGACGSMGSMG